MGSVGKGKGYYTAVSREITMNRTSPATTAAFLILLALIGSSQGVSLAQPDQTSPSPYASAPSREEPTVRRAALLALRNISRARLDLHRSKLASARHALIEAGGVLGSVREDLATAPAKNFIQIARRHLEYEQPHQVVEDLPPIYFELGMLSGYLPTGKAKLHIDKAKEYLEGNDKRGAAKELAMAEDSLVLIEVEFPLTLTQQYVKTAQGYLAAGKPRKADKALLSAEKTAITLYTGMNSPSFPLFQAKRNLWLALQGYPTAKVAEEGPFLEQARGYLEKAAAGRGSKGNEEAGKLAKEIAGLEKKLSVEGKLAESELKAAWEKSKALSERDVDYLATSWEQEMAGRAPEDNLIEAKLHLAYAESYQLTGGEPTKAVEEIDKTEAYLARDLKGRSLGEGARRNIGVLKRKLEQIKQHPGKNDAAVQESYDAIAGELNGMIHRVETSDQVQKMEGSE